MNVFLQNQEYRHESQRRKRIIRVLKMVQQISLIVFAWLVAIAGLYGVYILVMDRNLFTVAHVEVEGEMRHLNADEVRSLAGVQTGDNLFHVAMGEVQRCVGGHPWVGEVAVRRKLPHSLWIFVTEREPVALMLGKKAEYVDIKGARFPADDTDLEDLPVMTGFDAATPEDTTRGIALIGDYQRHMVAGEFGLSEVHFDSSQGFSVVGSSTPVMIRLGWRDLDDKLDQFMALWPAIKSRGVMPSYVDTNVSGKVIAKYGE